MLESSFSHRNGDGGRRKPAATIYDVARLSGVSPSTVSRALNKPGRISAATEQRIREIAVALGYQTNPMARALPTGRTQTIALLVSDITNPVYFEVIRGAERIASEHGYVLILAESQESADVESAAANRMMSSVDALILVSPRMQSDDIARIAQRKPVLLVNRVVRGIPSLVPDVTPGIAAAVDHLADLGHESVAYLAGPSSSWMSRRRLRVLRREAQRRQLAVVPIGPTAPTVEGGETLLRAVLESAASSVLAFNDLMAIGLMRAAGSRGIAVPDELSVMGFDDIFGSDFTSPPMTTIRSPLDALGQEAARLLIAMVTDDGDGTPAELRTQLIPRGSTGAAS